MYKHCTTEESALRQRHFEHCLQELMLTMPYPQITVSHICQRAELSRKSFYRYFTGKEGCLCALLDHCIFEGAFQYLPENPRQLRSELFESFFLYWKQMHPLLDALIENHLDQRLVDRMMIYIREEEHNFQHYIGSLHEDSDEQMLFMISGIMALVINWHKSGHQKSPGHMAEILEKILRSET